MSVLQDKDVAAREAVVAFVFDLFDGSAAGEALLLDMLNKYRQAVRDAYGNVCGAWD